MSVKLITITPYAEKTMSYIARVSNPTNQNNENIERLLRYCFKNGHWSVFETCYMTIEINTNITIANQLLRHRSFTFQQFSQRYANINNLDNLQAPLLRRQDHKNRQNSIDNIDDTVKYILTQKIEDHYKSSIELYNYLIDNDIAKECARFVLPCNTPTRLYMTGNIRSWIHYIQVRTKPDTQYEHRIIADKISKIVEKNLPIIGSLISDFS